MNLTETQKQQIIQAFITAMITLVLAIASILGYNLGIKPALDANSGTIGAQSVGIQPAQSFRAVTVQNFLNNNGTLSQVGAATFTGAVSASSTLAVGTFQTFTPASAISVTNGVPITATATYQPLQSAGTVTTTVSITNASAAAFTAGTRLVLINTSNTSIVIQDTGTTVLSGDITLGQYDTLELWFDGSRWVQISTSNN